MEIEAELKELKERIVEVEIQIREAEKRANPEFEVEPDTLAYWRSEVKQLREKERQLREEELQLLEEKKEKRMLQEKASSSALAPASAEISRILELVTKLVEKLDAKDELERSVRISTVSDTLWDSLKEKAGFTMGFQAIKYERWSNLPVFEWDDKLERSQSRRYISHLSQIKSGQEWVLVDAANAHPTLLSRRFQDTTFRGTTDVAYVHQNTALIDTRLGLKCIFELRKDLQHNRSKVVVQTVVRLVLANLFAKTFRPFAILTDLRDDWTMFWMDRSSILFHSFRLRSAAVGHIEKLLEDSDGTIATSNEVASYADEDPRPMKRRRIFDPPEISNLKDLVGIIPEEEVASAQAQIVMQLLNVTFMADLLDEGVPDMVGL